MSFVIYHQNKRYIYSIDEIEWRAVLYEYKYNCFFFLLFFYFFRGLAEYEFSLSGNSSLNKIGDDIGSVTFTISLLPTPKEFLQQDIVESDIEYQEEVLKENDKKVFISLFIILVLYIC